MSIKLLSNKTSTSCVWLYSTHLYYISLINKPKSYLLVILYCCGREFLFLSIPADSRLPSWSMLPTCQGHKPTPSSRYNNIRWRGTTSYILIFGTRWIRLISFRLQPLYRRERGNRYTLRKFWVLEPVCTISSAGKRTVNSFVVQYSDHAIRLPHKRAKSEQKPPYKTNMISELPYRI